MRRLSCTFLLASVAVLSAACFGDNTDQGGPANPDEPTVLEINIAEGLDPEDRTDVAVKVQGEADVQISVALAAALGTFEQQSGVVLTDATGQATFSTRYVSGAVAGVDTITANASTLSGLASSSTKQLTIYDVERLGNLVPLESTPTETAQRLIAYPMVLATDRVVRKLGIVHPAQDPAGPVDVQVGLYTTATDTSINALAKTTAVLTEGVNEIPIPPMPLQAGSYWMVVAYRDTPRIYRSTTLIVIRFKSTHDYTLGLTDRIDGLSTSSDSPNMGMRFYDRNFYLVLRK